jgi:hypothetical protein
MTQDGLSVIRIGPIIIGEHAALRRTAKKLKSAQQKSLKVRNKKAVTFLIRLRGNKTY